MSDTEEADMVVMRFSGATFDDVRAHGDSRASHLGNQPELFIRGEGARLGADDQRDFFRQLKGTQLCVVSHKTFSPQPPVSRAWR